MVDSDIISSSSIILPCIALHSLVWLCFLFIPSFLILLIALIELFSLHLCLIIHLGLGLSLYGHPRLLGSDAPSVGCCWERVVAGHRNEGWDNLRLGGLQLWGGGKERRRAPRSAFVSKSRAQTSNPEDHRKFCMPLTYLAMDYLPLPNANPQLRYILLTILPQNRAIMPKPSSSDFAITDNACLTNAKSLFFSALKGIECKR